MPEPEFPGRNGASDIVNVFAYRVWRSLRGLVNRRASIARADFRLRHLKCVNRLSLSSFHVA